MVQVASDTSLCGQAGVQVLFLVGNDAWASSDDTKEILQLLGCPKALSMMDVFWVSHQLCPDPYAIAANLNGFVTFQSRVLAVSEAKMACS
jgi:hypothetical protein